ncbi:hypothetical protein [Clostridium tyrobutyricum]|jgi:hypothetical protein|nr:hypothetical protein [Clostridium tyrobutyricum]
MLDKEKPYMVIAFHADIKNSKGTKDMINKARKSKIPCYIVRN